MPDPYKTYAETVAPDGQLALLTFRAPDGKLWTAAAVLTPLRTVLGEERGYAESADFKLEKIKMVSDG